MSAPALRVAAPALAPRLASILVCLHRLGETGGCRNEQPRHISRRFFHARALLFFTKRQSQQCSPSRPSLFPPHPDIQNRLSHRPRPFRPMWTKFHPNSSSRRLSRYGLSGLYRGVFILDASLRPEPSLRRNLRDRLSPKICGGIASFNPQ